MSTKIQYDDEARKSIMRGAEKVHQLVAATLGPRGSNIIIAREWGDPRVVHDGVTVSNSIELKDEFERAGADLLKGAAKRTNDEAGDGTTLTTILAFAIFTESLKNIAAGSNAMMIRRGIEKAVEAIDNQLYTMSQKLETTEQKNQIATISAQDENIGKMIIQALEKVGEEGVVTVERGNTADIEIEYKEGMQFDKGWISPHFVNNPTTGEAIVEKPVVIVTNKTIGNMLEFLPLLQLIVDQQKINQVVIIAKNVIGEVLATLAANHIKGALQCICIEAPGSAGLQQDHNLEDIAKVTGATFVNEDLGRGFNELTMEDLGRADKVTSNHERTIIVGGKGDPKVLKEHVAFIRQQLDRTDISEYDRERLQERLAKLVAGVAVINVGANSEAEADEKRERIIDAVSATKAAIEEGIVPGGETALLEAMWILDKVEADSREEEIGIEIVRKAIRYPYLKLLENSSITEAEAADRISLENNFSKASESIVIGIDVIDGKAKDLLKAGIIDPVKVTRSALKNAASTAIMLMSAMGIIVPIVIQKDDMNAYQPR